MNMKQKIRTCLILLLTAGMLFSCGTGESAPASTGAAAETAPATTGAAATAAETQEEAKVEMTAVPGLSADTVDYYASSDMNYACFVTKQNGAYGFIGADGKPLHDGTAKEVEFGLLSTDDATGFNGKWGLYASDGETWDSGFVVKPDGSLLAAPRYGMGFIEWAKVYWTEAGPELILGDGVY